MPKLQLQDFYFGVAISALFKYNQDASPSLIDQVDDLGQLWNIATNTSDDFQVYIKYTAKKVSVKNPNQTSWSFNLSDKEKDRIAIALQKPEPLFIILVCGLKGFNNSEIAVLTSDDYQKISDRTTIYLSVRKDTEKSRPRNFDIQLGRKRSDCFPIERNRIEKKLTDLIRTTVKAETV